MIVVSPIASEPTLSVPACRPTARIATHAASTTSERSTSSPTAIHDPAHAPEMLVQAISARSEHTKTPETRFHRPSLLTATAAIHRYATDDHPQLEGK